MIERLLHDVVTLAHLLRYYCLEPLVDGHEALAHKIVIGFARVV